jgi:hypothetical protein
MEVLSQIRAEVKVLNNKVGIRMFLVCTGVLVVVVLALLTLDFPMVVAVLDIRNNFTFAIFQESPAFT